MESANSCSIVWPPRQPLYPYTILLLGPFLINDDDGDDTAVGRKNRRFFRNIPLVVSYLSVIGSPDYGVC